ncbi:MAG: hypothetical protein OEU84_17730, partial [Xanthomonadales bacterium]|nr:hypothetical protein [Xanthomonadales bacterium]
MSVFTKALFSLLVFTVVTANAQIIGTEDPSEIEATIETLNEDIAELHLLTEKIKTAQKMDRDVLVFRQDERSFRLLGDFETLVKQVADLPDEAPKKKELKAGLIELSDGVSDAIFNRIAEIKQRIDHSYSELESLSGTAQVTSLAFLQGLEATRIGYYQAMANHIKGRDALGLSSDELLGRLDARINLYAETLAGRIEMTAAAQTQIKRRAELVPGNADIESALMDLAAQHQINLARLEAMILVLDDLGLSSSSYKTTLLQHSGSDISVSLFSSKALLTVLRDSWVAVKSKISANAPDMLFRLLIFLAVLFV